MFIYIALIVAVYTYVPIGWYPVPLENYVEEQQFKIGILNKQLISLFMKAYIYIIGDACQSMMEIGDNLHMLSHT